LSRRRSTSPPRLVLVDKPIGPTSFDVVRAVRRVVGERRVGHGGTLDPFASGLLVIGVGPATRLMNFAAQGDKIYRATMHFGAETDSADLTGEIVEESGHVPALDVLRDASKAFLGEIEQIPPRHSAIKIDGQRAYARARAGEDFEVPARRVTIHALEILEHDGESASFEVVCSGGTYVRTLARDLARAVGARAHLTALRRTHSGALSVDEAIPLDQLEDVAAQGDPTLDPAVFTRGWPRLDLDCAQVDHVRHGGQPESDWWEDRFDEVPSLVALCCPDGELVAVAEAADDGDLRLAMVLPQGVQA